MADPMRCPDEGRCHHGCGKRCWRVSTCGPLSGVFPDDQWPAEVEAKHIPRARLLDRLADAAGSRMRAERWEAHCKAAVQASESPCT